jgi:hypothetical protein
MHLYTILNLPFKPLVEILMLWFVIYHILLLIVYIVDIHVLLFLFQML